MKQSRNILFFSGKPWAVQAAGQPFVYFDYNLVGDNTKVYSSVANDWERNYTYDWLGRRLTYTEGELAESLTYNGSNLSTHMQNWLENGNTQSKTTTYHYNAHRLDSVGYDDALTTIYHYDQYGRVDSLYDESGVMCYEYGNMGEVTQETRIYALPFLSSPVALSTQFTYDSWGRIQNITNFCANRTQNQINLDSAEVQPKITEQRSCYVTFPDNEVVSYGYNLGGQLQSITNNSSYTYLNNVTYDRFGAKVSQTYGNGLVTNYSYNNLTRRLSTIATLNGNSQISTFAYTYDNVGNVTQVTSTCPWLNSQTFSETFTYDASDQLTAATEMQNHSYSLSVTYGNWGKITSYSLAQTDRQNNTTQSETQAYTYPAANSIGNSQTLFAPQQRTITDISNNVATETLSFGINGSLRKRTVQSLSPYTEYYLFNSAANLKAYSNNGLDFAYYGYNASNTRTYKLSMLNMGQWVNGHPEPLDLHIQQAMFYPNAYLNFNQNGEYTKHYYNGSERIASRLGSSTQPTDATSNDRLEYRLMRAEEKFRENIQELVSEWHPVDLHGSVALVALQPTGTATDIFYYHPNHLGSTAYVTDQNQNITQGFLYAPFGEITTEYAPLWQNGTLPKYTFNAKELDEETGMYYYEARYYKPPVFTSRDPNFERYPTFSPYTYCYNNPIKHVDPTGKDGYETNDGNYIWVKNQTKESFVGKDGKTYTRITGNKSDWKEALTIRKANIEGLVALGFDRSQVEKDVRLYAGDNPLFTKESKLNNANNYVSSWEESYNSGGTTAFKSPEIKNTGFSLKYYPEKNGEKHSLGIVKTGHLGHFIEGAFEKLERIICSQKADNDPLYDMHYSNANALLFGLKKKSQNIEINAPPTIYSVYHRSGGMKLP